MRDVPPLSDAQRVRLKNAIHNGSMNGCIHWMHGSACEVHAAAVEPVVAALLAETRAATLRPGRDER